MVIYNGPVGEPVENPNEAFIKDIFFYDEPYGFFIMSHPDYLVPFNKNIEVNTIEHLAGGEPMKIPTCSYVSRSEAYKIIKQFILTKKFLGLLIG